MFFISSLAFRINRLIESISLLRENVSKTLIYSLFSFTVVGGVISPTFGTEYDMYSRNYDKLESGKIASSLGVEDLRMLGGVYVFGDVLEIAIGTGLQSDYYIQNKLSSFTGIDTSSGMLKEAAEKIKLSLPGVKSSLKIMDAEKLEFADNSFDSVIDTYSLCVIDQPETTVKEMVRVVKKGGTVVLVENSLSNNFLLGKFQDITEPLLTPFSKGCKWNVNVPALAKKSGLKLVKEDSRSLGLLYLGIFRKS